VEAGIATFDRYLELRAAANTRRSIKPLPASDETWGKLPSGPLGPEVDSWLGRVAVLQQKYHTFSSIHLVTDQKSTKQQKIDKRRVRSVRRFDRNPPVSDGNLQSRADVATPTLGCAKVGKRSCR
jgi:hypothetical protein